MKATKDNLRVNVSTPDGKVVAKLSLVAALDFRAELDVAITELADSIDIKLAPLANRSGS